jgi:hypothetical protein
VVPRDQNFVLRSHSFLLNFGNRTFSRPARTPVIFNTSFRSPREIFGVSTICTTIQSPSIQPPIVHGWEGTTEANEILLGTQTSRKMLSILNVYCIIVPPEAPWGVDWCATASPSVRINISSKRTSGPSTQIKPMYSSL